MKNVECIYCEKIVPLNKTEKARYYLPDMKGRICEDCILELEATKK